MAKKMFTILGQLFTANVTKEDTCYVAICKEIGTADQGRTAESALRNLKACTASHLKAFPKDNPMYKVLNVKKYRSQIKTSKSIRA